MECLDLGDVALHYADTGPRDAPALVFANSLGTDFRLWDGVLPHLPARLRVIRYDKRGHGLSTCPPAPYSMGALVHDAERLLDALEVRDCVFVGLSIGGMIAQGLAAKRLDLVRAVVLSNTAPPRSAHAPCGKSGSRQSRRRASARCPTRFMERWFSRDFRDSPAVTPWRRMVEVTPAAGYAGCSAAIAGTDFYTPTAALRLPALVIGGSEDGSTPPDLVRELADLNPRRALRADPGAGASSLRRTARGILGAIERISRGYRPHGRRGMSASPFDSALYRDLFGDAEVGRLFSDSAEVRAMMLVLGALAKVQGQAGVIPEMTGAFLHRAAMELADRPRGGLATATGQNGVTVPGLGRRHAKGARGARTRALPALGRHEPGHPGHRA